METFHLNFKKYFERKEQETGKIIMTLAEAPGGLVRRACGMLTQNVQSWAALLAKRALAQIKLQAKFPQ